MIKDRSSHINSFNKIFLDEKNWSSRLLVTLCLICNSLICICYTFSLTSGGVNVKIPSLGTLTPLPIRRLRLMYSPRAFQMILISSSLKLPSILYILSDNVGGTLTVIGLRSPPTFWNSRSMP